METKTSIKEYDYCLQNKETKEDFCRKDSSSSTDENYVITTKVCKRLSREIGLQEIMYDDTKVCDAPRKHGLSNSELIIPEYYHIHKHPSKILDIDFYKMIKDDIRNCRTLNKYQLEYIKELHDEYKYELILLLNDCIKMCIELLN
jgi:hypothetical protein